MDSSLYGKFYLTQLWYIHVSDLDALLLGISHTFQRLAVFPTYFHDLNNLAQNKFFYLLSWPDQFLQYLVRLQSHLKFPPVLLLV